jgi:phosphate transport system substrate-binding protein
VQAIVVYVNSSNPVKSLTLGQLQSIFLGKITNWKGVGGPDLDIHLYAGESSTGTLSYFQDSVLKGEEPYPFVGKSNTKGLLDEIAARRDAIGYASFDSAPGVRAVAIQPGPHTIRVEPTSDSIRSRRYPLTRFITWVTERKNGDKLKPLLTWVLGSEGQLVVESVGFEPLLPADRQSNLAKFASDRAAWHLPGPGK